MILIIVLQALPLFAKAHDNTINSIPCAPNIQGFYSQEMVRLDKFLNPLKSHIEYEKEFDFFLQQYFSQTYLGLKLKMDMEFEIINFQTIETVVKLRAISALLNLLNQREINNDDLPGLNQLLIDSDRRVQNLNMIYEYVTHKEFARYLTPNRLRPMLITKS